MGREGLGPIAQYNSLTDPYLQGYYSKNIIRSHLKQTGLISRRGEIIPDEVWRKRIVTKEKMEQASRLIASKIVQQAIEMKNLERAEIRRKLEDVAKRELVRRIRGQSAQNRELPLLWADNRSRSGERASSSNRRNDYRSLSPNNENYEDVRLVDDEDYYKGGASQKPQRSKSQRFNSRKRLTKLNRGYAVVPKATPAPTMVTMYYYGKGVNIPFDTQVFESRDEISILQQHCGGENLLIYSGLHKAGDKFEFKSKRHKEYPFSLTIYINGTYDCRISTCCEYKHQMNVRIGGKTGRFSITNVVGGTPCIKCLLARSEIDARRREKEERARQEDDYNFDVITEEPNNKHGNANDSDERTEIPVNETEDGSNEYDNEFDDDQEPKFQSWIIRVYTSDLAGRSFEGTDSNVYLYLIGENDETERIWLNKDNSVSEHRDLFESGNCDEFLVKTSLNLESVIGIRIGQDESETAAGWHLAKVEVVNKKSLSSSLFHCDRWLAKDEDDGKIEREFYLQNKRTESPTKLEIPLKHQADDFDTDRSAAVYSASKSPTNKIPSRKSSVGSVASNDSRSKSKRLSTNDIINEISDNKDDTFRSSDSKSSYKKDFEDDFEKDDSEKRKSPAKSPTKEERSSSKQSKSSSPSKEKTGRLSKQDVEDMINNEVSHSRKSSTQNSHRSNASLKEKEAAANTSEDESEVRAYKVKEKTPSPAKSPAKSPSKSPSKSPTEQEGFERRASASSDKYIFDLTNDDSDTEKLLRKLQSPSKTPSPTKNTTMSPLKSPAKSPSKTPSPTKSQTKSPTKSIAKSASPLKNDLYSAEDDSLFDDSITKTDAKPESRKSSAKHSDKRVTPDRHISDDETQTETERDLEKLPSPPKSPVGVEHKSPSPKPPTPAKSPSKHQSPTKEQSRPQSRDKSVKSPSGSLKKDDSFFNDSIEKGEETKIASRNPSRNSVLDRIHDEANNTNLVDETNNRDANSPAKSIRSSHSRNTNNPSPLINLNETKMSNKSLNNSRQSHKEEEDPEKVRSSTNSRQSNKDERPSSKKSNISELNKSLNMSHHSLIEEMKSLTVEPTSNSRQSQREERPVSHASDDRAPSTRSERNDAEKTLNNSNHSLREDRDSPKIEAQKSGNNSRQSFLAERPLSHVSEKNEVVKSGANSRQSNREDRAQSHLSEKNDEPIKSGANSRQSNREDRAQSHLSEKNDEPVTSPVHSRQSNREERPVSNVSEKHEVVKSGGNSRQSFREERVPSHLSETKEESRSGVNSRQSAKEERPLSKISATEATKSLNNSYHSLNGERAPSHASENHEVAKSEGNSRQSNREDRAPSHLSENNVVVKSGSNSRQSNREERPASNVSEKHEVVKSGGNSRQSFREERAPSHLSETKEESRSGVNSRQSAKDDRAPSTRSERNDAQNSLNNSKHSLIEERSPSVKSNKSDSKERVDRPNSTNSLKEDAEGENEDSKRVIPELNVIASSDNDLNKNIEETEEDLNKWYQEDELKANE